jgi:16S rRNA (adenine1518-N6/adenine1519-N6)-dimethyltransferase
MEQPVIATREVTSYILHAFKLRTHKSLGQNFLIDPTVVTKIAQVAELSQQDTVLEIGPWHWHFDTGFGRDGGPGSCR